jgi:hypothetical protein
MNPSLRIPGKIGLFALHCLFGKPDQPTKVEANEKADFDRFDLRSCSPCDDVEPVKDPDESLCKLSLTSDESRHPKKHKGSFGHDFDPFM